MNVYNLNEHANLRCSMQPIYFRGTLVKTSILVDQLGSPFYTDWRKQKTDYFPKTNMKHYVNEYSVANYCFISVIKFIL